MKKMFLFIALLFAAGSTLFAQRSINGVVKDTEGETLIGASVLLEGTTSGTVSDVDGNFSMTLPVNDGILVVSYTGYPTQRITVTSASYYEIVMESGGVALTDLVVVGYGTQNRKELTGSISKVGAETIRGSGTGYRPGAARPGSWCTGGGRIGNSGCIGIRSGAWPIVYFG